jgi:alkaline phosphatase
MKSTVSLAAFAAFFMGAPLSAQTIYPIDRAEILAGAKFDFKVEFPDRVDAADIKVTINGADQTAAFGKSANYVEREDGKDQSALLLRDVTLDKSGTYTIDVSDGARSRSVSWNVYDTGPRKAKNVILFIGDGMSLAHRVGARILSKGIGEGKSRGKLAMDDMPHMALVATAGSDSIITDSANSASAYATGHKTAANAMGVYADRTADAFDDPRVETITSLAKRKLDLAIGIVTNTEVEDATPAAMVAHTRRRAAYDEIVAQFFAAKPDVLMGGGAANFQPQATATSKRKDDIDYIARFRDAGYPVATTDAELNGLAKKLDTRKLLGLFNPGNMDGVLDRKFLGGGSVKTYPQQPDLTEQVHAALNILSRHDKGFFLMVESGLIDKYTHFLNMDRAVYDTIMLDNAVKLAREWSVKRGEDTLILVVSDHSHSSSLVGTVNDGASKDPNLPLRERISIYDKAGFPNYPAPDVEGYPSHVDVSKRIAILSAMTTESVHSGDDVILTATGPGSDRVRGSMDNTDVFRVMVDALGLAAK